MVRTACLLLLTTPLLAQSLLAQSPLRASRHAGLPSPFFGMIAVGDVDGDDDLDIVAAADSSPLRLRLNDGGGRFTDAPTGRLVSPPGIDYHAVDLADIDGDGDLDVLAANEDALVEAEDGSRAGASHDVPEHRADARAHPAPAAQAHSSGMAQGALAR